MYQLTIGVRSEAYSLSRIRNETFGIVGRHYPNQSLKNLIV